MRVFLTGFKEVSFTISSSIFFDEYTKIRLLPQSQEWEVTSYFDYYIYIVTIRLVIYKSNKVPFFFFFLIPNFSF